MNVKTVVLAGMAVFAISSTLPTKTHAYTQESCGPRVEFNLSHDNTRNDNFSTGTQRRTNDRDYNGADDAGWNDYRDDGYTTDPFGHYKTGRDNTRFGIRLTVPLGESYCTQQKREQYLRDKANARRQELDNIERTIKLCQKYGKDNPHLAGKCK